MKTDSIAQLIEMSNKYGSQTGFVLAGGGNTSYKDKDVLTVKASGHQLAAIKADGFVRLERSKLAEMWSRAYSSDATVREREILEDLMNARLQHETNRPSVEAQLHDLFPFRFVLHLHPAKVNGVTCGKTGRAWVNRHFPDTILWIEASKPGYLLAKKCKDSMSLYQKAHGIVPQVLLIENHGVFFAADSVNEIDGFVSMLINRIDDEIKTEVDFTETKVPAEVYQEHLDAVKHLDINKSIVFEKNMAIDEFLMNPHSFDTVKIAFTPDHVVYCRHEAVLSSLTSLRDDYQDYLDRNGFPPRIILLKGSGMFAIGDTLRQAENARLLFLDQIKIGHYASFFGGPQPMTDSDIDFILNWEVENYRFQVQSK